MILSNRHFFEKNPLYFGLFKNLVKTNFFKNLSYDIYNIFIIIYILYIMYTIYIIYIHTYMSSTRTQSHIYIIDEITPL